MVDLTGLTVVATSIAFVAMLPLAGRREWWPWAAAVITVLLAIFYDLASPLVVGAWFYLAYPLFAVSPLAVYLLVVRYAEAARPSAFGFRLPTGEVGVVLALTAVLLAAYYLLTLEAGVIEGFYVPGWPDPDAFAVFFLTAPVMALGQEAIFRGYFLTRVSGRMPFRLALFGSSAIFAFVAFNPFLFAELPWSDVAPQLFLLVFIGFVEGLFLGFLFYKTRWSLLAPWVFRSVILGGATLFPLAVARLAWESVFVLDLIAFSALIVLLFVVRQEPRYEARHYLDEPSQPRRRTLVKRMRAREQAIPLVVLVGIAVLLVAFAGPVSSLTAQAPVRFLAIESGSMAPTFVRGTLVVVEHVASASDLHVGEIVAYNAAYLSPNGPVVHRIVAIHFNGTQEVFTFKGDANPSPDPRPVVFSQVVGRVVTYLPYLGYLILSPELSISIVLVVVLVALYRESPGASGRRRRPVLPLARERA
jgi:signal peptidase I